jgi:hypothetical protein
MVAAEVFVNCYNSNSITSVKKEAISRYFFIKLSGAGARVEAKIRNCGFLEPEPKEIFWGLSNTFMIGDWYL